MSALRDIPAAVHSAPAQGLEPEKSVWVSANAGSGKTHVLAQRVLRHLLAGVPPAKILCLTFTKAAAANMADESLRHLGEMDGDRRCGARCVDRGDRRWTGRRREDLIFARRLFARTVETPGGLKIHTIHAFCERLLHLFPFEANVPGRFEVLDDLGQAELLTEAKRAALSAAEKDHGDLGHALHRLVAETSQSDFDELIKEAMRHRALFRADMPEQAASSLRRALGLGADESLASIETEMIEGGIAPRRWAEFADFLATRLKDRSRQGGLFREAAAGSRNPATRSPRHA